MFTHILVPLDGSDLAERALKPAVCVAEALSCKLTLLRVVPQYAILTADPTLYEEMNRLGEDEALAYLRSKVEDLQLFSPVDVACEMGQPADTIVQFAEEHEVDLIVMSSHGRSGFNRWVYGSVAERVLRHGTCATAIINARAVNELPDSRRVLVPLDGSPLAETALAPAKQLAVALGGRLYLLRVVMPAHQMLETASMVEVFDDIEHKERAEADAYLHAQCQEFGEVEVVCEVITAAASVAEVIVEYAAQQEIDMIVMSSHGRTGLQRWVFGSVAEKVLRSACCATMVIRDPQV
jgi:nucleotide-binding universal stress UspA family protein